MTENGSKPKSNPKRIVQAVGLLAVLACGVFLYWLIFMRGVVSSDDARFGGYLIDLSPEVSGTLTQVLVHEGNQVKKGDVLFSLDTQLLNSAITQSQAALESAKGAQAVSEARNEKAKNGARPEEVAMAQAAVNKVSKETTLAELEYKRTQNLFKDGVATNDQLDRAKTTYESAQQSLISANQNLAMIKRGTRKEDLEAAGADYSTSKSRLAEAQAAADRAQITLDKATVKAPFDGWVVRRWLDPGVLVSPGRPVVTVFDPSTLRVEANIEEKYLYKVAVGDEVDIRVDAFPNLRLKGRVTEILRATNSEFSLVPSEGVSGTFIKVTQRIPLRIAVQAPADLPIGPGLSVEVRVHVGTASAPSK